MTVLDDAGNSFTLDVINKEVRLSNGHTITLTQDQMLTVANAFQGMVNNDAVVDSIDNAPDCNPILLICDPPGSLTVNTPAVAPGEIGAASNDRGLTTGMFGSRQAQRSLTSSPSVGIGTRRSRAAQINSAHGLGALADLTDSPNCSEIKANLLAAIAAYHANRTSVLGTLLNAGRALIRGDLGGFAEDLQTETATEQYTNVNLGFIIMLGHGYGCITGSWSPGSNGGPRSLVTVCDTEMMSISLDGGVTFLTKEVVVCEEVAGP